jgi:hypothetical protein
MEQLGDVATKKSGSKRGAAPPKTKPENTTPASPSGTELPKRKRGRPIEKEPKNALGLWIKERQLTFDEAAKLIGLPASTLKEISYGERIPTIKAAAKIKDTCGIPFEYWVDRN